MMSQTFVIFSVFIISSTLAGESCWTSIHQACGQGVSELNNIVGCTAQFGGFNEAPLHKATENLVARHIQASMKYMLIGSHFGEWKINRPGFNGFFMKSSDEAWEDALNIMQKMIIRGGRLSPDFMVQMPENEEYEMGELEALSKALDIEKEKATETLKLVDVFTHGPRTHDGAFANELSEHVNEKQALKIKHLANHVNSLASSLNSGVDTAFVLHTFDHHLYTL